MADLLAAHSSTELFPGRSLVGKRVAREFDEGLFFGTIKEHLPTGTIYDVNFDVWYVEYDDGDNADYNID